MRKPGVTILICTMTIAAFAQPPLNKRDQKRKAAFEAQIAAEEKYEKTIEKADEAFQNKDYVTARMLYAEAIQYNPGKEQWLTSKVNDLDILMARNIARAVDSVNVMATKTAPEIRRTDSGSPARLEQRTLEKDALPLPADSSKAMVGEQKPVTVSPEKAPEQEKKPAPKPKEKETPVKTEVKVKEDFSGLPQGLTEETFDFPDHQVLRIVVKDGIDTIVYKRVTHRWGGKFYFKDDVSITERIWLDEVAAYRQKYPSENPAE